MFVTGDSVRWFLEFSSQLEALARQAAKDDVNVRWPKKPPGSYRGDFGIRLSPEQLGRFLPGFIRVEDVSNARGDFLTKLRDRFPAPKSDWRIRQRQDRLDSASLKSRFTTAKTLCCNLTNSAWKEAAMWETRPEALTVRALPDIGWVALMPVPGRFLSADLGGFWVGEALKANQDAINKATAGEVLPPKIPFLSERPYMDNPKMFGQQAGWVLTREQVVRLNKTCLTNFLPPFTRLPRNGIKGTVEFYSGGLQLVDNRHCKITRVLSLDPAHFARHLLHHTSDNKQYRLPMERFVPADVMLEALQDAAHQAREQLKAGNGLGDAKMRHLADPFPAEAPAYFDL
eukprot:TRINITY_DN57486_c0_g1_i1.p1 TRINITY_DN57486_c0_g1~~TRINITY_DN57486_c0_g1_i1.p1  ORF type:complete len:344 (+),score=35.30 TRINITY_DN57486_c0_g1_i1:186-1217(+)